MKLLLSLSIVFASVTAMAALLPLAESKRRLRAIIDSPVVYEGLSARTMSWISSISHRQDGLYEIQVEDCKLVVKVVSVPGKPNNPPALVPELAVEIVSTEADCSQD